jgi:adenylylsulfate kinase-like enzyme
VRANLSRDLGFSHEDRVEHARRWDGCAIASSKRAVA